MATKLDRNIANAESKYGSVILGAKYCGARGRRANQVKYAIIRID